MILTKEGDFYRSERKDWEFRTYGFYPCGLYDLWTNNMAQIARDEDKSEWATYLFNVCYTYLQERKRWPDELNPSVPICKTRLCSKIQKLKDRLAKWAHDTEEDYDIKLKYGSQNNMSRDPYITFIYAAVKLGYTWAVVDVSIPCRLWRPKIWAWHRALRYLSKPVKPLRWFQITPLDWYLFWDRFTKVSKHDYVNTLQHRMDAAFNIQYLRSCTKK